MRRSTKVVRPDLVAKRRFFNEVTNLHSTLVGDSDDFEGHVHVFCGRHVPFGRDFGGPVQLAPVRYVILAEVCQISCKLGVCRDLAYPLTFGVSLGPSACL